MVVAKLKSIRNLLDINCRCYPIISVSIDACFFVPRVTMKDGKVLGAICRNTDIQNNEYKLIDNEDIIEIRAGFSYIINFVDISHKPIMFYFQFSENGEAGND